MNEKFDFILPEVCRIDNLDKTLQEMKNLIQKKKKLFNLDFREAKEYDLAGIQLLISFLQDLTKKKCKITVQGPITVELRETLLFLDLMKLDGTAPELFYKQIDKGDLIYE